MAASGTTALGPRDNAAPVEAGEATELPPPPEVLLLAGCHGRH